MEREEFTKVVFIGSRRVEGLLVTLSKCVI